MNSSINSSNQINTIIEFIMIQIQRFINIKLDTNCTTIIDYIKYIETGINSCVSGFDIQTCDKCISNISALIKKIKFYSLESCVKIITTKKQNLLSATIQHEGYSECNIRELVKLDGLTYHVFSISLTILYKNSSSKTIEEVIKLSKNIFDDMNIMNIDEDVLMKYYGCIIEHLVDEICRLYSG